MAQNLQLDPVKRDYIVENGSPIPSDRIFETVYFPVMIPKGKWVYGDQDQGSLIYTLNNIRRTGSIEQQFASYAEEAVRTQVIAQGKATAVDVKNLASSRTGTSNQINVVPSESSISEQLDFVSV